MKFVGISPEKELEDKSRNLRLNDMSLESLPERRLLPTLRI